MTTVGPAPPVPALPSAPSAAATSASSSSTGSKTNTSQAAAKESQRYRDWVTQVWALIKLSFYANHPTLGYHFADIQHNLDEYDEQTLNLAALENEYGVASESYSNAYKTMIGSIMAMIVAAVTYANDKTQATVLTLIGTFGPILISGFILGSTFLTKYQNLKARRVIVDIQTKKMTQIVQLCENYCNLLNVLQFDASGVGGGPVEINLTLSQMRDIMAIDEQTRQAFVTQAHKNKPKGGLFHDVKKLLLDQPEYSSKLTHESNFYGGDDHDLEMGLAAPNGTAQAAAKYALPKGTSNAAAKSNTVSPVAAPHPAVAAASASSEPSIAQLSATIGRAPMNVQMNHTAAATPKVNTLVTPSPIGSATAGAPPAAVSKSAAGAVAAVNAVAAAAGGAAGVHVKPLVQSPIPTPVVQQIVAATNLSSALISNLHNAPPQFQQLLGSFYPQLTQIINNAGLQSGINIVNQVANVTAAAASALSAAHITNNSTANTVFQDTAAIASAVGGLAGSVNAGQSNNLNNNVNSVATIATDLVQVAAAAASAYEGARNTSSTTSSHAQASASTTTKLPGQVGAKS